VVAHELLHLLGVGHEQQRPDRDRYLAINWTNIDDAHAFNFFRDSWIGQESEGRNCYDWRSWPEGKKGERSYADCASGVVRLDLGHGYDYRSIMHYQYDFFAKDKRYGTLVPTDKSFRIELMGGESMTDLDVAKLRDAYRCKSEMTSYDI